MRTRYKHVSFAAKPGMRSKESLPQAYECRKDTPGDAARDWLVGEVRWHSTWKCYAFVPESFTGFSRANLDDIGHFMGQLPTPADAAPRGRWKGRPPTVPAPKPKPMHVREDRDPKKNK